MQKQEPKTWDEVQRHYAMFQKESKNSLASEVITDLVKKNRIRALIIVGLITLIIIQMHQKRRALWKVSE